MATSVNSDSPNWNYIDIKVILCMLFTLVPNDKIFKELNINNYYYATQINSEVLYLNEVFLLLNKPLVRYLAYTILQPLLQETNNISSYTLNLINNSVEQKTLKNYLKKFKYFYKLFFIDNYALVKSPITEKEINNLAIKLLFFLVGI